MTFLYANNLIEKRKNKYLESIKELYNQTTYIIFERSKKDTIN